MKNNADVLLSDISIQNSHNDRHIQIDQSFMETSFYCKVFLPYGLFVFNPYLFFWRLQHHRILQSCLGLIDPFLVFWEVFCSHFVTKFFQWRYRV